MTSEMLSNAYSALPRFDSFDTGTVRIEMICLCHNVGLFFNGSLSHLKILVGNMRDPAEFSHLNVTITHPPRQPMAHDIPHEVRIRVSLERMVFAYPRLWLIHRFSTGETRCTSRPDRNGHHFALKTLDDHGRTLQVVAVP
jgi:hypothetical protein